MGTPWRSKKFHEAYFGDMGDNTLPDQVAGMKQLAEQYPFIDIDRAGIWGHSGGGFAAAGGDVPLSRLLQGRHRRVGQPRQPRLRRRLGGEVDGAAREDGRTARSNYDSQANQNIAKNLKGHLLLAHGTMDSNVPPNNTLLVVDALIKANKDFDLLMLPNQAHGYGSMSQLHDAPAVGLLRPLPDGGGAAEGVSAAGRRSLTRPGVCRMRNAQ